MLERAGCPRRVIRVALTASKASPNVRYAFNGDRLCASQRTDAMCHEQTSPVCWILAIIGLGKSSKLALVAPNSLASALGVCAKMFIALAKISINRSLGVFFGLVVAIVDDCPSHTAENRLNHI